MPSVAERIYLALYERLLDIRGADFNNDLQGRVHLARPNYDLSAEDYPAVFLAPRPFVFTQRPGTGTFTDITLTFDAVGVIGASTDATAAINGLRLLADMQRAIEVPSNTGLRVDIEGVSRCLLPSALVIVDAQYEPAPAGFPYELAGIGIECTFGHKYGDPDYVPA